jgi:RNA polymerase sigma-70 factor (ECF subfamily)
MTMSTALTSAVLGAGFCEQEGAAIARGLRLRDPDLLDRLIEQNQHRLLRYLLFLTGRQDVAEDLFQETWLRVLERGAQYNGRSRFDTWLFAIARHLVIDASRRKTALSLEAFTEPDHGPPLELAAAGPSPHQHSERRELSASLGRALARLDAVQREVVLLRFQEEMSLEEIAQVTGAPLSTVKSRLYRGLEAMRPSVEQELTAPQGGAA